MSRPPRRSQPCGFVRSAPHLLLYSIRTINAKAVYGEDVSISAKVSRLARPISSPTFSPSMPSPRVTPRPSGSPRRHSTAIFSPLGRSRSSARNIRVRATCFSCSTRTIPTRRTVPKRSKKVTRRTPLIGTLCPMPYATTFAFQIERPRHPGRRRSANFRRVATIRRTISTKYPFGQLHG
jgi:hypothetical protein